MIKLMIVDDEKNTRDSLKQYIPWTDLGIDAVETAKNGVDALELAKQFPPDILLTDVRMPKMNGIDLANKVSTLYPNCKIIFLSGYSDKDYLKAAIHLRAVSYIEKPLNEEEIKSIMKNAVALFKEDLAKREEEEKLKNNLSKSFLVVRQNLVLELINEISNSSIMQEKLKDIFSDIPKEHSFTVITFSINWQINIEDSKKHSILDEIINMINQNSLDDSCWTLGGIDHFKRIVAILISDVNMPKEPISSLIKKYFSAAKEISETILSISLSIGKQVNTINKIPESYTTSLLASNKQFYYGMDKIYNYDQHIEETQFNFDQNIYESFEDLLRKDDLQSASNHINKLTENIKFYAPLDTSFIKNIYFNLLLIIDKVIRERNIIPQDNKEKDYIWREVDNKVTLGSLSDYVISKLKANFENNAIDEKSRKTHDIIKYIMENISNHELSLQDIANNVYLSQSYLCAYFKKSTGKTVNEFITEARIEKAIKLLRNSQLKLYEVASSVGYNDVNYFSTIFKKQTGYTPSEYKEKYHL